MNFGLFNEEKLSYDCPVHSVLCVWQKLVSSLFSVTLGHVTVGVGRGFIIATTQKCQEDGLMKRKG